MLCSACTFSALKSRLLTPVVSKPSPVTVPDTTACGFGFLRPNNAPNINAPIAAKARGVAINAIELAVAAAKPALVARVAMPPLTALTKVLPANTVASVEPTAPPIVLAQEVSPVRAPINDPMPAPEKAELSSELNVKPLAAAD